MAAARSIAEVVVVPRNGYGNRLQAWASASALGEDLGARLRVLWQPEAAAAALATDLFSEGLIASSFVEESEVTALLGGSHTDLPRYLVDRGDVLMLAGHDRGEQRFMKALETRLRERRYRALVIVAGGVFHLPGSADPIARRRQFYRRLQWSGEVEARTAMGMDDIRSSGGYLGIHVRGTDRSTTAPTERQLRRALSSVIEESGPRPLYIAADTAEARKMWFEQAHLLGLDATSLPGVDLDRSARSGGIDALADWRALAGAQAIAYSRDSTFGAEAVVAAGSANRSIGVRAHAPLRFARRTMSLALGPVRARQRLSASSSQASTAAS